MDNHTYDMEFFLSSPDEKMVLDYCHLAKSNLSNEEKFIYSMIAMFSMSGSIIVALSIFYKKKLQAHPATLIAAICFTEAISCFNGVIWVIGS